MFGPRALRLHPCFALIGAAAIAAVIIPSQILAQTDPVTTFIIEADSVATAGGDEALAAYVSEHSILVGAVVGQLLDVGFEIAQAGDTASEAENLAFAKRVARLFEESGGSGVPMALVRAYQDWTPQQRTKRAEIKTLEAEAFEVRNAGDFEKAAEMFRQVLSMCEEIDDKRTIAVTWGSLGVVYWYLGDMAAVEASYTKALEARRAIEDGILEGKTLNGLGSVNFRTGNYEKAIEYYGRAADLRRRTGDLGGLGISLTYKGNSYYQMNRLVEARESFEEAYEILESAGSPAQLLEVLNSIGSIYAEMGSLPNSNEAYLRAIEIAATVDQPQDEAACRMNLAGNLRQQGRFNEALEQFEITRTLLDQQPEPLKEVIYYRQRGTTYLEMGELDNAREDLLRCVELGSELDDPFYRIDALIELGYLYQALDAFEQSRAVAEQVQPLAEETGNSRLKRSAYVLASSAEQSLGNVEEALVKRRLALEIDEQEQAEANVVEDHMAIASLYAVLGETEKARAGFYDALVPIRESELKALESAVYFGVAHTFENENPDSAVYHYERGLELIESSRASLGGAEIRTGFLTGERRFFYEEVARYYASLGRETGEDQWYDRAFVTMERAKARGLLELLERPAMMETTAAESAMLDSLYRMEADTPEQKENQRRLEERYIEMRNRRVDESVGRLAQDAQLSGLAAVQKSLPKRTVLLEYALGDTISLLWAVDRKGFEFHELPNRQTLAPQIQRLIASTVFH